jgi:hypothetical protein
MTTAPGYRRLTTADGFAELWLVTEDGARHLIQRTAVHVAGFGPIVHESARENIARSRTSSPAPVPLEDSPRPASTTCPTSPAPAAGASPRGSPPSTAPTA